MSFSAEYHIFYAVILCSVGIFCGIIYDLLYCIRVIAKKNFFVTAFCDLVLWLVYGVIYVKTVFFYKIDAPSLFLIGVFVAGILLYIKSFHKIVAKFLEKLYNKVVEKYFSRKKDERRKSKKTRRGRGVFRNNTLVYSSSYSYLPDSNDKHKKGRNRRIKTRD